MLRRAIEAKTADDVLDVDDRIVDHFTQRNHQTGENHRVERAPTVVQQEARCEERERNRQAADQCRPPVGQKDHEDEDHEDATHQQCPAQVLRRHLDERRRPEDRRVHVNAAERGPHVLERRFHPVRDGKRVRAELFLDDEHQAGTVVDDGVADRRREALDHGGHIAHAKHGAVSGRDDDRFEVAYRFHGRGMRKASRWLGVSRKPPAWSDTPSPVACTTWSTVRPCAWRRSGSTSTCNCRSRWPQIATLATPGMAISRGRIVHLASVLNSTCVRLSDVMPIFMIRLRDDRGDSMTGGRATVGSCAAARDRRSCTICRAVITSVAGSRIRTTDERPRTDFERIVSRPGTPLSAASSGTVTRASTSFVESPGASVCTSTSGGANSGNTSSGVVRSVLAPH